MEKRFYLPIVNVGLLKVGFDPIQFVLVSAEFDSSTLLGCMPTAFLKLPFFLYYKSLSKPIVPQHNCLSSLDSSYSLHVSYPADSFPLLKGLVLYFCQQAIELEWQRDFWHIDLLVLLFTVLLLCFKLHFLLASEMLLLFCLILYIFEPHRLVVLLSLIFIECLQSASVLLLY